MLHRLKYGVWHLETLAGEGVALNHRQLNASLKVEHRGQSGDDEDDDTPFGQNNSLLTPTAIGEK